MKIIKIVTLSVIFLFALGCENQKNKQLKNKSQNMKSLNNELEIQKIKFEQKADEKTKEIYNKGFEALKEQNIIKNALNVGQKAPNFKLKNALGQEIELYDYLKEGPVILMWYRGGWCPYCNITLHYYQQELNNFKKFGANLLALTPELPDSSISTSEKHNLEFEVLSDISNKVAKEYGVAFELTKEVADIYNKKFNLQKYNGDTTNILPLAATYVIDTDAIIKYAFLDVDYRKRAEPSEILEVLKKLQ
jgi:peroxiredoxin